MKIPIIRQLVQNQSRENIIATLDTLEAMTEFRGVKDEELDVIGELITNLCGALEVESMIKEGQSEKDALNAFSQKVMGSIDK